MGYGYKYIRVRALRSEFSSFCVCLLLSSRNVIASPLLTYPFADIRLHTNSTDKAPKNSANWNENGADNAELINSNDAMWCTLHLVYFNRFLSKVVRMQWSAMVRHQL